MAVKTITIDLDAYEALARRKRKGQSFSEVIKEQFGGARTGRDLLQALAGAAVSEDTTDRIEARVAARRRERARAPRL